MISIEDLKSNLNEIKKRLEHLKEEGLITDDEYIQEMKKNEEQLKSLIRRL